MDRRRQDRVGIGLLAVSLTCMVGLLGIAYARNGFREARDELTACSLDEPPAGYVALVVDETDALSEAQVRRLERERDRILSEVGPDEMVSIYVVDDRASPVVDPVLALCSPGSGRDANPIYQNPRKREARFREAFAARLDAVVEELERPRASPTSPILETIRAVASSPEFERTAGRRELVIVSDLLQNVPGYSQYRGRAAWEDFEGTAYASTVAADLAGADVRVIYLRRAKDLGVQDDAHRSFWERYFRESGAARVEVLQQ